MEIWASVSTSGDICFGFSAGSSAFDEAENIEELDTEWVEINLDSALGDALWEAMNGDAPDEEVLSVLQEDPRYSKLKLMEEHQLEQFIYNYVVEKVGSSSVYYEADGEDITELFGNQDGLWDKKIFEAISINVLFDLREIWANDASSQS